MSFTFRFAARSIRSLFRKIKKGGKKGMEFFKFLPDFDGGTTVPCIYNIGCGIENEFEKTKVSDGYMMLVTGTTADGYRAYIDKLTGCGWRLVFENSVGQDLFAQLEGERLLYVYFTAKKGEVRIIIDESSSKLADFGYPKTGDSPVNIVQYGLYYDPENGHSPTTTNCGMFYIVKLPDNSLFLIDGGDIFQCGEQAMRGRMEFLHRLTGTAPGEKMRVACWFITHAHNDHFDGCSKMLNRYHDELSVERFVFNFPCTAVRTPDNRTEIFKGMINKYCPGAKYLKAHRGQVFELCGVRFEVLYACEDAIRADSPNAYPLRDYNCTSTVIKMSFDGHSVLWLGDTNVETENIVTSICDPDIWKSDVVQVAHHCFNYLSKLYPWIDAPYAMLPNSYFAGHTPENLPKLADVIKRLSDENNIWYSERTTGFEFIGRDYVKVIDEDLIGREYDGSGF